MASTAGSRRTTSINHSNRFTGMTFPTVTRRVRPEEDHPRENPGQECGGQREVRIQNLEQIIIVLDLADRPLQKRDAFREHQRSREPDAGDLRHRAVDSERVEAEQVDLDVTTKAGEDLERLEGEASALADVGSDEENAH